MIDVTDDNEPLDVLDVAAEWARLEELDTDEWQEDDFLEYFYNDIPWQVVVDVQWRSGRFAGVKAFGGLYLAYDDEETQGPFQTLDAAEARLDLEREGDAIAKYSRAPQRGAG